MRRGVTSTVMDVMRLGCSVALSGMLTIRFTGCGGGAERNLVHALSSFLYSLCAYCAVQKPAHFLHARPLLP
jgi:hypothetical protein